MKKLIITVDTEGDDLWSWHEGDVITTKNANYIMRFQELCEKYDLIPTYLVNYEISNDILFVKDFKRKASECKCEIGMHLHAWNSPPDYKIENRYNGQPFITEYPLEIIREKHLYLKEFIEARFETSIESYRSGRWATNDLLFDVLEEIGIHVDCSVTPGIDHGKTNGLSVRGGNNYSSAKSEPYRLRDNLIEIPMTSLCVHTLRGHRLRSRIRNLLLGERLWLRSAMSDLETLLYISEKKKESDYLEFMIHSSELMPGGSPYFPDELSIERHYSVIEEFFKEITKNYQGISLKDYSKIIEDKL